MSSWFQVIASPPSGEYRKWNPSLLNETFMLRNWDPPWVSPDSARRRWWVSWRSPLVHLSRSIAPEAQRQSMNGRWSVSVTKRAL